MPPTNRIGQGARATPSYFLLIQWDLGIRRKTHDTPPPVTHSSTGLDFSENLSGSYSWVPSLKRGPLNIARVRHVFPFCFWQVKCKIRDHIQGEKIPDFMTHTFIFQVDLVLCKQVCHRRICDIHLLFWHFIISLAMLTVHDCGGRAAARLSHSRVFVYSE